MEEPLGRVIAEGSLLIATDGEAVGQVNGISAIALGGHAFGRSSRITARTFGGEPGVVDIEREAKLGGPAHSKGVIILTGFLAGRYARERPGARSLHRLRAALRGDRGRQRLFGRALAVTGSVNQQGEIQAVGGINEKIEGFFDVCRARRLTGRQGVLIPKPTPGT